MAQALSRTSFKTEIIDSSNIALVQFKTEWSGACQIVAPIYEELAILYKDQVRFFTVDAESETAIGEEYGIMELPTILLFRSGKVIDHVTGLVPKNVIISKIENALTTLL